MTPDPLDTIRKLLELAAHETTPVEEARTSAVKAAKWIIEHKVELYMPGGRLWGPPAGIDDVLRDFNDFFSDLRPARRSQPPPPDAERRQIFTALCPDALVLKCTCCGAPVRPGTRIHWIGKEPIVDDETVAKVTHDSCKQHWGQKRCPACKKNTDKSPRERLTNQRRDPPGTVRAERNGFCYCCGKPYDVDEKVVCRGFSCVHVNCYPHLTRSPCPRCGGGARV